jgi:hypothetical protein
MKVYFKGGKGIEKPTDINGIEIKEGSILTTDNFDGVLDDRFYKTHYPTWTKEDIDKHWRKPTYKVKWNEKGFFYGEGLKEPEYKHQGRLYLHDFRFEYTKVVL